MICNGCFRDEAECVCEPFDMDTWERNCKARGVDPTKPIGWITPEMEKLLGPPKLVTLHYDEFGQLVNITPVKPH